MNRIAALPAWLQVYTLVLLGVSTLGCWAFVALYHRAYRWWGNEFGRHLVAFSACLGLFLTYYCVLAVWPGMPWRVGIRTALFTLLAAVIVWRLVLFGRVSWALDRSERSSRSGSDPR